MTALGDNGPVVVAGAGLAGSLLAIYLARQGHDVTVYESRPDLRTVDLDAGRSINLALATRGIVPLIDVGVIDQVDDITIAMRGRMVHALGDDSADLLPYGSKRHEVIHSVSRNDFNAVLLDAAEATGRVSIEFGARLRSVDFDASRLVFDDGSTAPFGVVFGADGAGSPVRQSLAAVGSCVQSTEWLDHDYKELTLPPGPDGGHLLDPHALHIWPRGELMLIALANPSGDFTLTLFAPEETFAALEMAEEVRAFFGHEFPEVSAIIPDLTEQFTDNPTSSLGTLRANGWSHGDQAVIVGDAAHAIVPFHGQGMNAALESVRLLDRHLRDSPDDIARAFARFEAQRKPDTEAIAQMAIDNYVEMRSSVIDPAFREKRQLALDLERRQPAHISPRYNMVMFSTMPYTEARDRAAAQAKIIEAAVADPSLDVDALVVELPPLPEDDPLADPGALTLPDFGPPQIPADELTYGNYLQVAELLSLQRCRSVDPDTGKPEHDETLFIIIHQVYELWFKQLLHELDHIVGQLDRDNRNAARHHLTRVLTILKTLIAQIDVLETMTPAEFASFRHFLANASGFQSAQFREIEFVLGVKDRVQLDWFEGDERDRLTDRFHAMTLWDAVLRSWHRDGIAVPEHAVTRDVRTPIEVDDAVQAVILANYGDEEFSALCEMLTDLDERLQEWRYRHVMMVRRTIGTKAGTGGSDGAGYLQSTLFRPAFPDLWAIRTEF